MGLQIYPQREMPIEFDPDTLNLVASRQASADVAVAKAIKAFNSGEFEKAEKAFLQVSDPLSRGIGLLAVAGRPDYENELANTQAAVEALRKAAVSPQSDGNVNDLLETAEIFLSGLNEFKNRGLPSVFRLSI